MYEVFGFNPRALTSPDIRVNLRLCHLEVSIHGLLRALTGICELLCIGAGFNPRALTSPDLAMMSFLRFVWFQSTGSYEP